ncbi:uncharacterized protein TRAVEDRAFT_127869 [Trametes versicolor FP-101664 SS1]|uniref:uncharacterized protein n=1 Tax=Trametes versicolor (strain FP-101664) TaxID=717944 RepID=UPI000462383D|nr:uncharacterized protein TRAVEDRAFT_127869 [Trametes versicolor FP-101664 SS1]EIW56857.1 hypothetical protein TRAVEDRAFT_127869 [Trametes versicolor FP-101664 SS1]
MPEQSVQRQERGNREPSQDAEGIEGINSSDDTLIEVAQEVLLDDSEDHQLLLAGDRFWFEDGNVILVAGDTRFRVYQGLLAAQSSVLAHIFSSTSQLVNTPTSEEIISGLGDPCLVVRLSDSPEDLRHMLRLFMPSALLATGPSFEFVSACIRLGLKYEIKQIYDTALAILKNRYTDNIDHWDSLSNRGSQTGFDDIHAIGVVNLARLIGDSSMLPVALWQCCRLGSDLVHGLAREDGTRENLTLDDLGLCFAAQERLIKAGVRARLRVFAPTVSEKCQNATKCKEVFVKALRSLEKKADIIAGTDPFVPYTRISLEGVLGLCSTCSSEVKARDQKERRAVWNRLPALLGIEVPGWGKVAGANAC